MVAIIKEDANDCYYATETPILECLKNHEWLYFYNTPYCSACGVDKGNETND